MDMLNRMIFEMTLSMLVVKTNMKIRIEIEIAECEIISKKIRSTKASAD